MVDFVMIFSVKIYVSQIYEEANRCYLQTIPWPPVAAEWPATMARSASRPYEFR